MAGEKERGWRVPVVRVGAAMQSVAYAVLLTVIVSQFNPTLRSGALLIIFGGFSVAFYVLWIWIFVVRPAELAKKLPVSGKELRRRKDEFYRSLPK